MLPARGLRGAGTGDINARVTSSITATVRPFDELRWSGAFSEWRDLAAGRPAYLSPDFFALERGLCAGEALVAEARADGRLVGVLPLVLQDRSLGALATDHTPGFDYVGDPDGVDAIWGCLTHDSRWDVLTLERVRRESPLVEALRRLAYRDLLPCTAVAAAPQLVLALQGFESRLRAKFLTNLRRCARKAGGVTLERLEHPVRKDFREAFALEARAWKGQAGTSIDSDRNVEHLYEALVRLSAHRGRGALSFLRARGERIALMLSVEDRESIHALKIGYEPAHAALSPGHLLVWMVAADAERRGLSWLDFGGREDAWKHKWTDQRRDRVSLLVYRRSPRGIGLHLVRDLVKPLLPETMRDLHVPLRAACQGEDVLGQRHGFARGRPRVHGRSPDSRRSPLDRRRVKQALLSWSRGTGGLAVLGAPSRFQEGSWVRVKDEASIRATLDAGGRHRHLALLPAQWHACGNVYRVLKQVRRARDSRGVFRPVSGTVILEGVTCDGPGPVPMGCGRRCPAFFRDDWLEPAEAPKEPPPPAFVGLRAHVRDWMDIRSGLDLHGRRDGVTFLPEMEKYAGARFRVVTRVPQVREGGSWTRPRGAIYILEGLHCEGGGMGACGPCDSACPLLWHEDWLILEEPAQDPAT